MGRSRVSSTQPHMYNTLLTCESWVRLKLRLSDNGSTEKFLHESPSFPLTHSTSAADKHIIDKKKKAKIVKKKKAWNKSSSIIKSM